MNKNTTMLQLFQGFDEATKTIAELKSAMDALKRNPELESITYTADDYVTIIGETYKVKSAGDYVVKSEGSGRASFVVRESKELKVIYEGDLEDTSESEVMHLTVGDTVYLHSSADNGMTESITLQQKSTLFDVISDKLDECNQQFDYLNARIDNLLSTGDIDEMNERIEEVFQSVSEGKTLIANAITDKGTVTETDATFAKMALNILSLSVDEGIDTSLFTATANDILKGKTAGVNNQAIIGTMEDRSVVDNTIGGLDYNNIDIPVHQEAGGLQISAQTGDGEARLCMKVPTGFYDGNAYVGDLIGNVASVLGLTAEKLLVGQNAGGISGEATGDGTAVASQILSGMVAYVKGVKITGTMPDNKGTSTAVSVINRGTLNIIEVVPQAGYHGGNTSYKTGVPYSTMASTLGIAPEVIVEGFTICGVKGTGVGTEGCEYLDVYTEVAIDDVQNLSCTRVDFITGTMNKDFIANFITAYTSDEKAYRLFSASKFAKISVSLGGIYLDGVVINNTITWKAGSFIHETIYVPPTTINIIDAKESGTAMYIPIPPTIKLADIEMNSLYIDFYADVQV